MSRLFPFLKSKLPVGVVTAAVAIGVTGGARGSEMYPMKWPLWYVCHSETIGVSPPFSAMIRLVQLSRCFNKERGDNISGFTVTLPVVASTSS